MILEAVDRVTAPARRVKAAVADMTRGTERLAAAERAGYATGVRLRAGLGQFASTVRRAGAAARSAAGRAGLAAWTKSTELAKRGTGALIGKIGGLIGGVARWGAAAGTAASGWALFDMFGTASEMEQVSVELAAVTGSMASARKELEWVRQQNLAVPVIELAQSYLALRKIGIAPTAGNLRILADEARASKRPMTDLLEVMKEAKGGDFGGLEELKIQSAVKGNIVTFTWLTKEGKRASRSVRNSADEIERAMLGIFEGRSAGASARYATTFDGMIEGIKDRWKSFMLTIAESGIFERVKNMFGRLLDWIEARAADGSLERWGQQISDWLGEAVSWVERFTEEGGWQRVGAAIQAVSAVVGVLVKGLSNAYGWYLLISKVDKAVADVNWGVQRLPAQRSEQQASPIGWGLKRFPPKRVEPQVQPGERLRRWNARPRQGASAEPVALPGFAQPRGRQASADVSGLIRLQVEAKPGTSVRTTGIEGSNARVPLRVDVGRSMVGAA